MMDGLIEEKKELISYDAMCAMHPYEKTILGEIVNVLAEVESGTQESYTINGSPVSSSLVKRRLAELDHEHVEYVLESLNNTRTRIANIRAYLIASLYNAPQSIAMYYQQRCLADGVI